MPAISNTECARAPLPGLMLENPIPYNGAAEGDGSGPAQIAIDVLEGAALGGFSRNDSSAKLIGQFAAGFIPVYGQVCDARDTAAALRKVWRKEPGAWRDLGIALLGWLPGFGDMLRKNGSAALNPAKIQRRS